MSQPGAPDVLLAAKPGKTSPHAESRAFQMAARSGGRVRLLYVVDEPGQGAGAAPDSLAEAVSQRAPAGVGWDVSVGRGEPWRAILQAAEASGCGLIVMGPRERGGMGARLMGTTGEHVIHRARQPVLTVRRPAEAPYRHVVAAIDFSEGSRQALVAAAPWVDGAEIALLHAYRVPYEGFLSREANADEVRASAEADCARFLAEGGWPPGLGERVEPEMAYGTPLEVLAARAREGRADLVVVGAHGQTGPFEKLLGGTAEQLLSELLTDLLVAAQSQAHRRGA
ncbi:universal stress protein [Phenylobacterium terrae]|uniref:Universal stress protein n=1 Tax=Phenylobacterium terrae TaxID=2665495 RepID=A0ABW4N6J5_9CAUL